MNTKQVDRELRSLRVYRGTFARNELCRKKFRKPFAIVINTDSLQQAGEHWVAVFAPVRGRCEYFDPMGWPPPHKQILRFLNTTAKQYVYCCEPLQGAASNKCGRFCIAFIKARDKGISYEDFINDFGWDYESNDDKVSIK